MKSLKEAVVKDKYVFARVDFDVGEKRSSSDIPDDFRMRASLPTINYLIKHRAKVILATKIGRPGGKVVDELSTRHLIPHLEGLLGYKVKYVDEVFGDKVVKGVRSLSSGEVLMLENLRFNPGEEKPSRKLGKDLASLAEIYINECFASSHRNNTSIAIMPEYITGYPGFRLQTELKVLSNVLKDPQRPLTLLVGGAKVETKLPVIQNFLELADNILVAGKLGFTDEIKRIKGVTIPLDSVNNFDIGPETIDSFSVTLQESRTIVWSGPMGRFEEKKYEAGTRKIAKVIASSAAEKVVGGGDTIKALNKFGLLDKMGFVSTGGGAMLEFLSGKRLPGLEALGYYLQ